MFDFFVALVISAAVFFNLKTMHDIKQEMKGIKIELRHDKYIDQLELDTYRDRSAD
jgi:hypothetical protein